MSEVTPAKGERAPVLFFDGGCGLCHLSVRVLLRLDRRGRLRFAPLGGERFFAALAARPQADLPDSLVLLTPDGRLRVRSSAVLESLRLVGPPWSALAALAALVPRRLRDALYDAVARARHRLFRPPAASCPRVPARLRQRFLS